MNRPWRYDLAAGVTGWTPRTRIAAERSLGATSRIIGTPAGVAYPWPTAAASCRLASANLQDGIAGTGVQRVRVTYLDAAGELRSVVIDTTGGGTTAFPDTVLRLIDLEAVQLGTPFGGAAGAISFETTTSDVLGQILQGQTRLAQAVYTVPADTKTMLEAVDLTLKFPTGANNSSVITLWATQDHLGNLTPDVGIEWWRVEIGNVSTPYPLPTPFQFGPLTDIYVTHQRTGGSASANAACTLHLTEIPL